MSTIQDFIEQFLVAVDFQAAVEVKPETVLTDLPEWDSLAALGVIVMFDSEYQKSITGDHLKRCVTVQELYARLEQ